MEICDWGEEKWISYLKEQFLIANSMTGIGDDCAVIPNGPSEAWLVTTDALIEGVHFLKDEIPAFDLGYKAVAVNVSDIAAMGGTPLYAFLTIALPSSTHISWLMEFVEGLKEGCKLWNINLIGGDTTGSKRDLFINLSLTGTAKLKHVRYRHTAQSGDIICITGYLGDAKGGLQALQEKITPSKCVSKLIHSLFRPAPHLQQGAWLAEQEGVHAMMDISDGLDSDLKKLVKTSRCGATIETSLIPLSSSLKLASKKNNWNALDIAISGGEDYCLLLTIDPEYFQNIKSLFEETFLTPLFQIGSITPLSDNIAYQKEGERYIPTPLNFNHFNQ